jgi:hypothetical protein
LAKGQDFHPIVWQSLKLDNFCTAANGGGLPFFLIPHENAETSIAFQNRIHHDSVAIFKNMEW